MYIKPAPPLERLRLLLRYEPDTGDFFWRVRPKGRVPPNCLAGTVDRYGYRYIKLGPNVYQAHRLAWFYVHDTWAPGEVDHINNIPSDNRIANLRLAERWQQRANQKMRKDNLSGFKGVRLDKRAKRWVARCRKNGVVKRKGGFKTPEEAHIAYLAMARESFGEFARAA